MSQPFLSRTSRIAAAIAFVALPLLASGSFAQEATPAAAGTPMGEMAMGDGPHPAHIHSGTCEELGDVVVPLTDVQVREGEEAGSGIAHPIKGSHTQVDMPLQDIIDGGHAINVHLSAEEIGTYIACGDISGVVFEDQDDGERMLIIALRELNDSGHTGIAWLSEDNEGAQTEVAINLIEPEEMS
jgi:hypothetical protein